jgi:hypothetical protein
VLTRRELNAPATSRVVRGARIETFEGVGVATLRDVVIVSWTSASTEARVRWAFDTAETARRGNPSGMLVLQLIARSSSPPNAAARKVAHDRFSEAGSMIRRIVTVPLGDDFWAAIVRSIMRGVFLLSGHSKRHFVATKNGAIDVLLEDASATTPTKGEIEEIILELQGLLYGPRW